MNDTLFGYRLRQIIARKGMTQNKFAKACRLDDAALSNFINGRHKPGFDTLVRMMGQMTADDINYLLASYAGKSSIDCHP